MLDGVDAGGGFRLESDSMGGSGSALALTTRDVDGVAPVVDLRCFVAAGGGCWIGREAGGIGGVGGRECASTL